MLLVHKLHSDSKSLNQWFSNLTMHQITWRLVKTPPEFLIH